jgi:hypothetical protein
MRIIIAVLLAALALRPSAALRREPILDVHMHALRADDQGPPPVPICSPLPGMPVWDPVVPYPAAFGDRLKTCPNPIWSPKTDDEIMRQTIAVMERRNIIGVLSGRQDRIDAWRKAAPQRFIPALSFRVDRDTHVTPDVLGTLHADGRLSVLGEVTNQYAGIAPDDARMEPYWTLAEKLDIPVGIHIGTGPPGVIYLDSPAYRARLHSPLTLEEVLVKHPRLRVYIMHAGYPMLDDLLAVLYAHPQVHVDVGVIVFTQPRPAFYRFLQGVMDAGFGGRVMFGSDQMVWPGVIEPAIAVIDEAPFLSASQKRDILYHNAARFLRLTKADIERHHGM